jgi:hypothetical protein
MLDAGTMQVIEKHVAAVIVVVIGFLCAVFQQDVAIKPHACGKGGGLAGVVGLCGALGQHDVGTLVLRLGHQPLQLAGLVATGGHAGAVVALDPDLRSAQLCRQARHMLQRRWQMGKMQAGKAGEVHVRLAPVSRVGIGKYHSAKRAVWR